MKHGKIFLKLPKIQEIADKLNEVQEGNSKNQFM
jgi:hypothetical protein